MLAVVHFPINVHVGDLSTVMHNKPQIEKAKEAAEAAVAARKSL